MSATEVAQTIQLIIAPGVLVTACVLVLNTILGRYASIGQLMRSLAHERLDLLRSSDRDLFLVERLQEIDRQFPLLIHRHRLLQNTAFFVYTAISILILSMLAIALSVAFNTGIIATLALILFLLGTATLLAGVCLTTREIRLSHEAICYEVRQIVSLKRSAL